MNQNPTWEFTRKYLEENPGASPDDIQTAYQKQQGKHAMNTRLLGG
jgi:hypothetical protein